MEIYMTYIYLLVIQTPFLWPFSFFFYFILFFHAFSYSMTLCVQDTIVNRASSYRAPRWLSIFYFIKYCARIVYSRTALFYQLENRGFSTWKCQIEPSKSNIPQSAGLNKVQQIEDDMLHATATYVHIKQEASVWSRSCLTNLQASFTISFY
jgi:hypothetical protein